MTEDNKGNSDAVLYLEKGKRGLLKIIFGRTTIVLLLLCVQAFVLFLGFRFLGQYIAYGFGGYTLLSLIIVIILINKPQNPSVQNSWIILILLIPVFGALLYIFVDTQWGSRLVNRRLQSLIELTRSYMTQDTDVINRLRAQDPGTANLVNYMVEKADSPVYENTSVKYFPLGEDKFEEMIRQLEQAKEFIFMEYFIVEEGYMWGRILKILEKKVKEGVEVRFMYDGMCSLVLLPYKYPEKLEALGIRCKMFSPIRPALSTRQNNRDHRKILVIDGHTAFTGGINLADEYINRKIRFGHWKDTAVMIKGDAVKSFTLMFLQVWNINERSEDYERYMNRVIPIPKKSSGFVMPYCDSPLDDENVGEQVYLDMINRAERYVHIMTPYLILDYDLINALSFAAKRGVEVVIIMPHIPDKKYAFALAKTYYPELIRAGVQIWEYTPGFIHAKQFVCDDNRAVVGTINLDYRSLYLHFECAAYMYQVDVVKDIESDFQDTLAKSQKITIEDCKKVKIHTKLFGRLLRLFAPLM